MRIVAGLARGRPIRAPAGRSTRPTSDRVREALFNILAARLGSLEGAAVLDLFAGSGALGLEALSRGAASCLFVDKDSACAALIARNARDLGFEAQCRIWAMPVETAIATLIRSASPIQLLLCDPPYATDPMPLLRDLDRLEGLRSPGLVVLEHARRTPVPRSSGHLTLVDQRRYGDTAISLFERAQRRSDERASATGQAEEGDV